MDNGNKTEEDLSYLDILSETLTTENKNRIEKIRKELNIKKR